MTPAIRDITLFRSASRREPSGPSSASACTDGLTGYGEATVHGFETELWNTALLLDQALSGRSADPRQQIFTEFRRSAARPRSRCLASAIDLALWDMEGSVRRRAADALLGVRAVTRSSSMPYKPAHPRPASPGFPRECGDRQGAGLSHHQDRALDGVEPTTLGAPAVSGDRSRHRADCGGSRGDRPELASRRLSLAFRRGRRATMLQAIAPFGVFWLESRSRERGGLMRFAGCARCHISENSLAGCELQTTPRGFRPHVEAGLSTSSCPM